MTDRQTYTYTTKNTQNTCGRVLGRLPGGDLEVLVRLRVLQLHGLDPT